MNMRIYHTNYVYIYIVYLYKIQNSNDDIRKKYLRQIALPPNSYQNERYYTSCVPASAESVSASWKPRFRVQTTISILA